MDWKSVGGIVMPPDRPKHHPAQRSYRYAPDSDTMFVETAIFPTGRARGVKARCKYCDQRHRHWWRMPAEEFPVDLKAVEASVRTEFPDFRANNDTRALLCGYCEHVSLAVFMDIEESA